jgi:hypothetical protein
MISRICVIFTFLRTRNCDYFPYNINGFFYNLYGETDRVRNEEVLHRVKEERNIIHTIKRRKANWKFSHLA